MEEKIALFWFRRDLRLNDNRALYEALSTTLKVLPVFVFDTDILKKLPSGKDARVLFIYREIKSLKSQLEKSGSTLLVYYGKPIEAFAHFSARFKNITSVYANRDYEPYALKRDEEIKRFLGEKGISFHTYKDHVVFEADEVLKDDETPYTVFTPYSRKWKAKFTENDIRGFPSESKLSGLLRCPPEPMPELHEMGFENFDFTFAEKNIDEHLLRNYAANRDIPAIQGTSKLGIHLRFGTVSIRQITKEAIKYSEVFLNELIWRNFFMQILVHFPYVVDQPFNSRYKHISWRNNEEEFRRWCNGETGYPLVDAGMRELNQTGFMHNRVRMVTASFLVKHLLIDWRWGEAYFADKLLDFELASNNGNWQWAAGTGCDAAPYFRVFNPEAQRQKFDAEGSYIKKWVPEADSLKYPQPMVEHTFARNRAIETYKNGIGELN